MSIILEIANYTNIKAQADLFMKVKAVERQ